MTQSGHIDRLETPLRVHPRAAQALDALAALGTRPIRFGAARAIADPGGPLVFAGLAWLLVRDRTVPMVLEEDHGDCYIEECAWAEVQGVAELLSASVEARRDLALAVAANAPDEKLPDFGLTGLRDPLQLMIDLGIPPRARDPQPGPSVFERARRRHALRRT